MKTTTKVKLTGAEKRVMHIINTIKGLRIYAAWDRVSTSDRIIMDTDHYNPGFSTSQNLRLGQISTWTTERVLNSLARKGLLPTYSYVDNDQTVVVADLEAIESLCL